jgi:hypothetical protein
MAGRHESEVRIRTISKGTIPVSEAKGEWLHPVDWIAYKWATDRGSVIDEAAEARYWAVYHARKAAEEAAKEAAKAEELAQEHGRKRRK